MARWKTSKRSKGKTMLRLPDLQQSKNAVLHSLAAASSQESYGHAIDEFIAWYCSEPRLAFNRTVVLRYRFFLEQKNLAPSTINVRLAAVRRLAYEASDTGLLSPELAVGIRRVKGAKRLGTRIGNWLTVDQSRTLLREPPPDNLRSKQDRAILALLIGCGLRRAELVGLGTEDFQIREEHVELLKRFLAGEMTLCDAGRAGIELSGCNQPFLLSLDHRQHSVRLPWQCKRATSREIRKRLTDPICCPYQEAVLWRADLRNRRQSLHRRMDASRNSPTRTMEECLANPLPFIRICFCPR
jgi:integrase